MKVTLFLIVATLLRSTLATLLAGNYVQMTCTGIEGNECFANPSSTKCRAITEMIEAKLYMQYEEGYGQVPASRRLQEESEQENERTNLRGGNRELQYNVCSGCNGATVLICQMYCCPGYCHQNRALTEEEVPAEEPKVCQEEFTLDHYLVDFPTKPIEKCFEGVDCVLEYLC